MASPVAKKVVVSITIVLQRTTFAAAKAMDTLLFVVKKLVLISS